MVVSSQGSQAASLLARQPGREDLKMQSSSQPTHQVAIQSELVVQDLVGLDLNVSGLALGTSQRLVDHDA